MKLLIEFSDENNIEINEYPDLEIVTDFEKGAIINAFNNMFSLSVHLVFHLSHTTFQLTLGSVSFFEMTELISNTYTSALKCH